jgi:hypothetical protein
VRFHSADATLALGGQPPACRMAAGASAPGPNHGGRKLLGEQKSDQAGGFSSYRFVAGRTDTGGVWYRHIFIHLAPIAGLALSCAVLWAILDRFDTIKQATSNVIAEAFISYLIIAVAFSQLYSVLNRMLANPFDQLIPSSQESTLLYFSMITLSSVGYGHIVPINPYLRLIAALESMVGLFYIAVVVSRLVAMRSARNHHISSEQG